jgi:hypothetical protein
MLIRGYSQVGASVRDEFQPGGLVVQGVFGARTLLFLCRCESFVSTV